MPASSPPSAIVIPGTGLRLYHLSHIHQPLVHLFPTPEHLARYLSALKVPIIPVGEPPEPYVNPHTLAIAFQACTRIGAKNPTVIDEATLRACIDELFAASSVSTRSLERGPLSAQLEEAARSLLGAAAARAQLIASQLPPAPTTLSSSVEP